MLKKNLNDQEYNFTIKQFKFSIYKWLYYNFIVVILAFHLSLASRIQTIIEQTDKNWKCINVT